MWQARDDGPAEGMKIAKELIEAARVSGRLNGVVLSSASGEDAGEITGLLQAVSS
jgi:hypothetical protein